MKAIVYNNSNVAKMTEMVFDMVENIVKKNKHPERIAWQYQVPYRLHIFLEV